MKKWQQHLQCVAGMLVFGAVIRQNKSVCGSAPWLLRVVFERVLLSADILHQKMTETCASAHIGGVNIVLLEGITPDIQYVHFFVFPPSLTITKYDCQSPLL